MLHSVCEQVKINKIQFHILVLSLEIGDGFNEFDKKNGTIKIFRKGFPWKEENIEIIYPIDEILRK